MDCTRSSFKHLICRSDEAEFISHQKGHCESNIITSQSSADISLVKFGKTSSDNGTACPQSGWYDEIPEVLTGCMVFLLVLTLYRRWQARGPAKAIRKALGFDANAHVGSLPTVSSSVGDLVLKSCGNRYMD